MKKKYKVGTYYPISHNNETVEAAFWGNHNVNGKLIPTFGYLDDNFEHRHLIINGGKVIEVPIVEGKPDYSGIPHHPKTC